VANVRVESEVDTEGGWEFRVLVDGDAGAAQILTVCLSWVDYAYWSPTGGVPPEKIAAKVTDYVCTHWLEREGPAGGGGGAGSGQIPERFDASTARRWFPQMDSELLEKP
jgi:hypothetical protein